jgi:hypothetical protein
MVATAAHTRAPTSPLRQPSVSLSRYVCVVTPSSFCSTPPQSPVSLPLVLVDAFMLCVFSLMWLTVGCSGPVLQDVDVFVGKLHKIYLECLKEGGASGGGSGGASGGGSGGAGAGAGAGIGTCSTGAVAAVEDRPAVAGAGAAGSSCSDGDGLPLLSPPEAIDPACVSVGLSPGPLSLLGPDKAQ